jgi:signal transduction histidine kinase
MKTTIRIVFSLVSFGIQAVRGTVAGLEEADRESSATNATAAAASQAPLTRVADVRALPRSETAKARPVRLRGVVTYRGGDAFAMQDETAGIYVNVGVSRLWKIWKGDAAEFARVRSGMVVEIEGVTARGGFSPPMLPSTLRIVGEQPLPPPRPMVPARFFSGADDSQWMEVRAVVQGVRTDGPGVALIVNANPGRFRASLPAGALPHPEALIDAEVRMRGVPYALFNTRGEFLMPNFVMNGAEDLVVEKPPRAAPFGSPKLPLSDISGFRAEPLNAHCQRVEGVVTYAVPGNHFYLQEGRTAVRVETCSAERLKPGDRVEVEGFLDETRVIRGLTEAIVRKTGTGGVPVPERIHPDQIMKVNEVARRMALIANPGDYDGQLITFEARLLNIRRTEQGEHRLTLDGSAGAIQAVLYDPESQWLTGLEPGCTLAVTGLAQLGFESQPDFRLAPTRVDVLLRCRGDLAVLRSPSWWTARRLLVALSVIAALLAASMGWSALLRRRVAVKSARLAEEMRGRHEAAVEFQTTLRERNRLAANLHDTLLQTLGGIGFQLEACEASGEGAGAQLAVARRMVDHGVDELRGSVWALRSLPLHGQTFPQALKALAAHVGTGYPARIEVEAEGPLEEVPDFVGGNLLLIVQEALYNALRHGHPQSVRIAVRADAAASALEATVRDDGAGFTLGAQQGPGEGHFGLSVMRERAERLGGTVRVESAPGQGTAVYVRVALKDVDKSLA